MTSVSSNESTKTAYPKSFAAIVSVAGVLALFLFIASTVMVWQPIGSTIRGYFYTVDSLKKTNAESSGGSSVFESHQTVTSFEDIGKSNLTYLEGNRNEDTSQHGDSKSGKIDGKGFGTEKIQPPETKNKKKRSDSGTVETKSLKVSQEDDGNRSSYSSNAAVGVNAPVLSNLQTELKKNVESSAAVTNSSQVNVNVVDSGCDLYHGKWIHHSTGPLYTNNSCPVITQMQNCQGNGRPDKDYENWRWKPSQCDLPRFDAKNFLELMRGKTLAFIGDSVARNQMESLLCILWQVEVPKNRGNRKMHRYYFRSTSTMIVRIWSSWLVHQTSEPFSFAPAGVAKLHLDAPDEVFMQYISNFDVIILSSGHWFAKQSVYILNNEIVGGQLWWPDKSKQKKIDNIEAFGVSVETILTALGKHENYTGLTIVRSFSPDHYEGGAWNTGGSCTGKDRPTLEGELVENRFTNIMHEKQVRGFNNAVKKKKNKSRMALMDITEAFSYRRDGHPGPYRSPDPNKITKVDAHGRPPPQDCLHWCMPGPVDTWNELVYELVRRDFADRDNSVT